MPAPTTEGRAMRSDEVLIGALLEDACLTLDEL
jgi:hypothetical protein